MRPPLHGQTTLALRVLRALASERADWSLARLAAALGTREDRLLLVLAPLTQAGWVTRDRSGANTVRDARPEPPPTLQEVIEAIEGSGPIDDCVLRPGVACGALRSAPVCAQHDEWTRLLTGRALDALALLGFAAGPLGSAPLAEGRSGHGLPREPAPLTSPRVVSGGAEAGDPEVGAEAGDPEGGAEGSDGAPEAKPGGQTAGDAAPVARRGAAAGSAHR